MSDENGRERKSRLAKCVVERRGGHLPKALEGQPREPRTPSAGTGGFARERRARGGRAEAEPTARRASPGTSRTSFEGEHLGKTNEVVESRASVMGTYASDDSDDEGSVVSVVHHGELASVAERRATQIRHVLREGPPDSEEDTPPAVRARRGDLDPFSLQRRASSRADAGRGPSRLSRRGERHANRDRHVVWRDERTTEGDPEGFGSPQMDAYGSRRRERSIRESSPPRYGDAYGAEPAADVRHYASPTVFAAPEFPELGRVASLARRYEDPRFFDASPRDPDVPEFFVGVERRSPAGFALDARNAETPKSGVDAAREALDDVARDLRDAHERSAQKIRALARAMDAREDRLAKSASELRDVQRRLAGVLAAVYGDVSDPPGSVDLEARRISISRADQLYARGVALRAAAAEKAAEMRAKSEEERDREEADARVARARAERKRAEADAEAAAARAEAETARASAAFRPSAAAARDTARDATRYTPRERPEGGVPREAPAETPASPATRSASRVSAEKEKPNRFEAEPPRVADLSRTRAGRPVPIPAKTTSDVVETTPGAANADAPSPAEVTPALTRAGRAAERTPPPAIPRERLVERFPEKTPTVRTVVKTPAGALALSRTRQAIATVSAMKPPAGEKEKEKEAVLAAGAGWTAGLTRAGRRVGPASPAAAFFFAPASSTGPGPSPSLASSGVPAAAPTLRDGMSLITGADGAAARERGENASDAQGKTRPGESWRNLSRTRAFGGKTRPDFGGAVTSAAAASGLTFEASRRPVDPQAAAVARSRMARTRR